MNPVPIGSFEYQDRDQTLDGRKPFPVTDPYLDAPDGAIMHLCDSGHHGWWQRQGDQWVPIADVIPDNVPHPGRPHYPPLP